MTRMWTTLLVASGIAVLSLVFVAWVTLGYYVIFVGAERRRPDYAKITLLEIELGLREPPPPDTPIMVPADVDPEVVRAMLAALYMRSAEFHRQRAREYTARLEKGQR